MHKYTISQKLIAEGIGTALLLSAVVGSGIMAQRLSGDVTALALLCNTIPTGAMLVVIISIFGPISGAHFNPAVTLVFFLKKNLSLGLACAYVLVQITSGLLGVFATHLMFEESLIQTSTTVRTGTGLWLSEIIATFGLLLAILGGLHSAPKSVPWLVGLYITCAYWFTASTSFANPAVTIARGFSDSFSGIAPANISPFIIAQIIGALIALAICNRVFYATPATELE